MSSVPQTETRCNPETFRDRLYRYAAFEAEFRGGDLEPGADVILLRDPDQEPVAEGETFEFAGEYLLRVGMVSGDPAGEQLVRLVAERTEVSS